MEDYATPAMKQYMKVKAEHPDCLLLFRMGDFYETFFDDAKQASKILNITLTKRGIRGGSSIPLAGIPFHALDGYLAKLVKSGIKVGICEQLEDPKLAKGVVKRGLTRIVTAGTLIEAELLDSKTNNYLTSILVSRDEAGIASADISTGELLVAVLPADKVKDELTRLSPAEIIVPESFAFETNGQKPNFLPAWHFHATGAETAVKEAFNLMSLEPLGLPSPEAAGALGALISYIKENHKQVIRHLRRPRIYSLDQYALLDKATIRNLELVENVHGGKDNTLLAVLDNTVTPMGARLLRRWVLNPLKDVNAICRRLDSVEELVKDLLLRSDLAEALARVGDIERCVSRISSGGGGQRELLSLKTSLSQQQRLISVLSRARSARLNELKAMRDLSSILKLVEDSISEPGEGIIKRQYSPLLDELRDIMKNSQARIAAMQESERARTGIKSLKIGYNKVFGYFIEVTKTNLSLVPNDYIRKQTTAVGERYMTEELKELEQKISGAEERHIALEQQIIQQIIEKVSIESPAILEYAERISNADALLSLAEAAASGRYTKPAVSDGFKLKLLESRHPVIETITEGFIPNDLHMDRDSRFHIITGPNMAGKSTFMRQAALIVLMAQIGSYVPAKEAVIPVADRIFTRVGAHDDLVHGQSTFMVEMNEVSYIVTNATPRSLIIMDEIGRGTSTYDGLSIAMSVALFLNERIKAKTLFATHYHALSRLEKHEGIKNYHASVKDCGEKILFTRKILQGSTDKSYGIHVAKLAGMPPEIIDKALTIQFQLEDDEKRKNLVTVERKKEAKGTVLVKGKQTTLA